MDRILALSQRLRDGGIECQLDQYHFSPPQGWPNWCTEQVEESDFVLIACTEIYLRRFRGKEATGTGLGGTWEGHVITQQLYNAQGRNSKFIPIVFSPEDRQYIPLTVQGATNYNIETDYHSLYRHLTNQPGIIAQPVGSVRAMPAREPLSPLPTLGRKHWSVPHARNPFFTGHEKILARVEEILKNRRAAALSGLGGVGKTQTAIEYAYRHRDEHQTVLWSKAETREDLVSGFSAIATLLNLPQASASDQRASAAAARQWFEQNSGWLLILDNADDIPLVRDFIPKATDGQILLTTRAQATGAIAQRIEIDEMEPEEGALLLLRRAGITNPTAEDRKLAMEISRELGGLPLALDQAGAFIEETPSSLSEYLSLYKSEAETLLARRGDLADEHKSVTVTFSLAFQKVASNSVASADLIRVCAFLAPDAIPEEIFTEGAPDLGDNLAPLSNKPLEIIKTIAEAARFSLINRNANKKTLDIHRLVQTVVKSAMNDADQRLWAERVVGAVNKTFPNPGHFANWPQCERLLPHAQACADLINQFDLEFAESALLLNQAGYYLCQRARFTEAEPLYLHALAINEKIHGPDHPYVAIRLDNLANLYAAQGKYAEAEPLSLRAIAIDEKAHGPDHPYLAYGLNNLAAVYFAQDKCAEVEPLYLRALAIWEKTLGPDHPNVGQILSNLGSLYWTQGKYAKAEPLYRRALALCEKTLDPEHPNVATSLNNLAGLYRGQGKYAEAEPLYLRALAILEKSLSPGHPIVASTIENLGHLYQAQNRHAEAEPLLRRAAEIRKKRENA